MNDLERRFVAVRDFHAARRTARMLKWMAAFTGRSTELLSYQEVRERLKALETGRTTLKEIPLDAIVGSVGRYEDYDRNFFPLKDSDQDRWSGIMVEVRDGTGLPPIEVYQMGETYFVIDGNHRVSVARHLGSKGILAYVHEVAVRVPLNPQVQAEDVILKAEYSAFLEDTALDKNRPGLALDASFPEAYRLLRDQIGAYLCLRCVGTEEDLSFQAASLEWYDELYMPVVESIRELDLAGRFPEKTETDLYLWISEFRLELAASLGIELDPGQAALKVAQGSQARSSLAARLGQLITQVLSLGAIDTGTPVGTWRQQTRIVRQGRLFPEILLVLDAPAVERGDFLSVLDIAAQEGAILHGILYAQPGDRPAALGEATLRETFLQACEEAGVRGSLRIEDESPTESVPARVPWVDMVAMPARILKEGNGAGLTAEARLMLRRCPKPVLVYPGGERASTSTLPPGCALLAFDGSPKAFEALYIAAYLAGFWDVDLAVLVVGPAARSTNLHLDHARVYLEKYGIPATYHREDGPAARVILAAMDSHKADLLIIGGYSKSSLAGALQGSTVAEVLAGASTFVMLCR